MDLVKLQNNIQLCPIHKSQLKYFCLRGKSKTELVICHKCQIQFKIKGEDLIPIDQEYDDLNDEILLNWPIVDNPEILLNYQNIFNDEFDYKNPLETVSQFFDILSSDIHCQIQKCKKKVFENLNNTIQTKQMLSDTYKQVSKKYLLNNCISEFQSQKKIGFNNLQH